MNDFFEQLLSGFGCAVEIAFYLAAYNKYVGIKKFSACYGTMVISDYLMAVMFSIYPSNMARFIMVFVYYLELCIFEKKRVNPFYIIIPFVIQAALGFSFLIFFSDMLLLFLGVSLTLIWITTTIYREPKITITATLASATIKVCLVILVVAIISISLNYFAWEGGIA